MPDITIITPVFSPDDPSEIIFFVASRGHHADVGGILPGSMPPTSTNIFEEGAEIVSFKIVSDGIFDRDGLYERMIDIPGRYPGSSGCRNIKDVESDLKAQIAANHKGIQLIKAMVEEYGLKTVQEVDKDVDDMTSGEEDDEFARFEVEEEGNEYSYPTSTPYISVMEHSHSGAATGRLSTDSADSAP